MAHRGVVKVTVAAGLGACGFGEETCLLAGPISSISTQNSIQAGFILATNHDMWRESACSEDIVGE